MKPEQPDQVMQSPEAELPPGVEFRGGLYSEIHNIAAGLSSVLATFEKNQPHFLGKEAFMDSLKTELPEYRKRLEAEAIKYQWPAGTVDQIIRRSNPKKMESFDMWIRTANAFRESFVRRIDRLKNSQAAQTMPESTIKAERSAAAAAKGLRVALNRLNELAQGLQPGSSERL